MALGDIVSLDRPPAELNPMRLPAALQRLANDEIHYARVCAVKQLLERVGITETAERISVILNADDMRGAI